MRQGLHSFQLRRLRSPSLRGRMRWRAVNRRPKRTHRAAVAMYAAPKKSERPPTQLTVEKTMDFVPWNMSTG